MRRLFADTVYWVALLHQKDSLHELAKGVSRQHASDMLVTTEMILTELANFFSWRGAFLRKALAISFKRFEAILISRSNSKRLRFSNVHFRNTFGTSTRSGA